METLLIINPYSRSGKSGALAKGVCRYLQNKNFSFDFTEINNFNDAYNISVQANKDGITNIVAVGGDGTINKVLNGFYDGNGNKISSSRFGVIHTGTSPDFCKSYNIPTNILQAADVIMAQRFINIPVGMIRLNTRPQKNDGYTQKNPDTTKYFVCCANIGLGASLARSAGSGIRGYLGDFLGTFISLLKILFSYRGTDYNILINSEEREVKNIINISVGITKFIASGIKVYKDDAIPDDQFYILKTNQVRLSELTKLIKILYTGEKFSDTSFLTKEYASQIEIKNNIIHPEVEFDGDPAGYLPCRIEIAKDRLQVFTTSDGVKR